MMEVMSFMEIVKPICILQSKFTDAILSLFLNMKGLMNIFESNPAFFFLNV
jgi:hypothetical protein